MKTQVFLKFIAALFIINIFCFSSCGKSGGPCELPYNVNSSEVVVAFKDKATGNYLYARSNPLYNKDSLKVFDENGNRLIVLSALNQIPNSISQYWDIGFGPLFNFQTDQSSFDAEKCKLFTIKYLHNQTDTVNVCFKAKKTKCGSVFETLKVYHKNILIGSTTNTTGVLVTIIKD